MEAEQADETGTRSDTDDAALLAELEVWRQKVQEQRKLIAQSDVVRGELRSSVEKLQKREAELTAERERLVRGGAAEEAKQRHEELQVKLETLKKEKAKVEEGLAQQEDALIYARQAAASAAETANAAAAQLSEEEAKLEKLRKAAEEAEASAAAAEKRLESMVSVEEVQRCEKESQEFREALVSVDKETRQIRLALADALSSATDLSMAKRELEILRESQEAASQRVRDLEKVNAQLETRIAQIQSDIAALKKGTVDLRSEEDLMREVIVTQNEQLLRKVEDLTDEEKIAEEDRRQLLATAARLTAEVESAEARIARASDLEAQSKKLDEAQRTLSAEVERLRRTNNALCQQVLGVDGEGPLAGVLEQGVMLESEQDQAIRDEINRLVRGQPLLTVQAGSIQADAAALALRLQQMLAEREEAFWVERQRLSDHIATLERTRNGRTSSLLSQYNATARGSGASGGQSPGQASGLKAAPAAAAAAVTGGLRRLRETIAR
eukprot:TRINITY_DN107227_c0_g1_i1.p1 TRINITY_DN107227_c0_g1~~TRINITY_DN107227_c0_g1_i1.p1  ORF type:complete len:498 (-),score=156.18 TRINITY_DN107227_c0_g1_i1:54-1547(-)